MGPICLLGKPQSPEQSSFAAVPFYLLFRLQPQNLFCIHGFGNVSQQGSVKGKTETLLATNCASWNLSAGGIACCLHSPRKMWLTDLLAPGKALSKQGVISQICTLASSVDLAKSALHLLVAQSPSPVNAEKTLRLFEYTK